MNCKIYVLKNKAAKDKPYVGQTWSKLEKRFGPNGRNYINSKKLMNAIIAYGPENFEYELLDECEDQETANAMEIFFINKFNSIEEGYNIKEGGSNGKHSEETKTKIGVSSASRERTPAEIEHITNLGKAWAGKVRGPHTEDWCEQISQFMIEWHANNPHPMLGKHHSEETKAYLSALLSGTTKPEEEIIRRNKTRHEKPENVAREAAIIADHQRGMTFKEICAKHKCGNGKIERALLRNGLTKERDLSARTPREHSEATKDLQSFCAELTWKVRKGELTQEQADVLKAEFLEKSKSNVLSD